MKLTLNSAIPLQHRQAVEDLVATVAPGAKIRWLPSRFPRLVMLVEPDAVCAAASSIFDDDLDQDMGDFSAELEDSIQEILAGAASR